MLLFKSVISACIVKHYRSTVYLLDYSTFSNNSSLFKACPLFDNWTHTVTYTTFKFELFCNFFIDPLDANDKGFKGLVTFYQTF